MHYAAPEYAGILLQYLTKWLYFYRTMLHRASLSVMLMVCHVQ